MEDLIYNFDEVQAMLKVSPATAYKIVLSEGFPRLKGVTGRILVPAAAFRRWVDDNTIYITKVPTEKTRDALSDAVAQAQETIDHISSLVQNN